jgi:tetratricopeptide (TPR) repeat protein
MIHMVAAMMAVNEGELTASAVASEAEQTKSPVHAVPSISSGRIETLSRAIEQHPDSPANYVLRGDAYLELGKREEAVEDYLAALQLAEGRQTDWEYLNRSFMDRARQGLRRSGYNHFQ